MLISDEVRGAEIFNFQDKKVGVVLYPLWRCKTNQLDGFVFIKNNFLQIKFFLPFSSVDSISNGSIHLIKNYKTRKNIPEIEHIRAIVNGRKSYISKYEIDEKTGRVKSVEIANSIYEDITKKRKVFKNFSISGGLVIINQEEEK